MQKYPHQYSVSARGSAEGDIELRAPRLPNLVTAAPEQFGGPGDRWSPETLCVGAVADCFILTFRALARATHLEWLQLRCDVEGTLDRVERVAQFTEFRVHAVLEVPAATDEDEARRALERAEQSCLIANSLKAKTHLETTVVTRP